MDKLIELEGIVKKYFRCWLCEKRSNVLLEKDGMKREALKSIREKINQYSIIETEANI